MKSKYKTPIIDMVLICNEDSLAAGSINFGNKGVDIVIEESTTSDVKSFEWEKYFDN